VFDIATRAVMGASVDLFAPDTPAGMLVEGDFGGQQVLAGLAADGWHWREAPSGGRYLVGSDGGTAGSLGPSVLFVGNELFAVEVLAVAAGGRPGLVDDRTFQELATGIDSHRFPVDGYLIPPLEMQDMVRTGQWLAEISTKLVGFVGVGDVIGDLPTERAKAVGLDCIGDRVPARIAFVMQDEQGASRAAGLIGIARLLMAEVPASAGRPAGGGGGGGAGGAGGGGVRGTGIEFIDSHRSGETVVIEISVPRQTVEEMLE
jgi:hypothetical protein